MFLLPSIIVGISLALLLGGRPSRLLELRLHHRWAVLLAFATQFVLFSRLAAVVPARLETTLHLGSYALLAFFALANRRRLLLAPLSLGMGLNALVIAVNGGRMPISAGAWEAAGLDPGTRSNVRLGGEHLTFLGDVFALPPSFPFANSFSVGDVLIALGVVAVIVGESIGDGGRQGQGQDDGLPASTEGAIVRP
jgi:hypothetical protein